MSFVNYFSSKNLNKYMKNYFHFFCDFLRVFVLHHFHIFLFSLLRFFHNFEKIVIFYEFLYSSSIFAISFFFRMYVDIHAIFAFFFFLIFFTIYFWLIIDFSLLKNCSDFGFVFFVLNFAKNTVCKLSNDWLSSRWWQQKKKWC